MKTMVSCQHRSYLPFIYSIALPSTHTHTHTHTHTQDATQNSARTSSVEADETDSHPLLGSGEGVTFVRREDGGQGDHVCEGVRWEGENSSEWVTVPHPLNGD